MGGEVFIGKFNTLLKQLCNNFVNLVINSVSYVL